MIKGYTIRVVEAPPVQNLPAWNAHVRRKGWQKGYWKTVTSQYGAIAYTTQSCARDGAQVWIEQNESE